MKLPRFDTRGLYARTAAVFFVTLLLVQLATLAVSGYLAFLPVFRNSVDDLAALMMLSAQTYVELPPGTRPDFVRELAKRHQLNIEVTEGPRQGERSFLPYIVKLEQALDRYSPAQVSMQTSSAEPRVYWVDLRLAGEWLRLSFPRERIGTHPPLTILLLLASVTLITLAATLLVTRRLTAPLVAMANATRDVGHGALPPPLDESGPREVAMLARRFNRMAIRVRELLDARTTMLAGISHDLRTPMARIRLQLELMRGNADGTRLTHIETDLEEMDALISQLLDIARQGTGSDVEAVPLRPLIMEVIEGFERGGASIKTDIDSHCSHRVHPLAFKRVLSNLLDNAFKHGVPPVEVRHVCTQAQVVVEVLDHGQTLPERDTERCFEPFVRSVTSAGEGLGLAIVRGLCHAHGWTITLSRQPDGGALARLQLRP